MPFGFKFVLVLHLSVLLFSCSKSSTVDDPGPTPPPRDTTLPTFKSVFPIRAKINDTITLTGRHFDRISDLLFNDETRPTILSRSATEMTVIVPVVYNEKVEIKAMYRYSSSGPFVELASDSTNMNLMGVFPVRGPDETTDIRQIVAVSDKVFYVVSYNQLYKTSDGGYKWELMKQFANGISHVFFINESTGWAGLYGDTGATLYHTVDGGKNFESKFVPTNWLDGNAITGIYFNSPISGYVLTGKGDVYRTTDNINFTLAYHFTNSNLGSNYVEFGSFSGFGEQVLATGNSGANGSEPMVIKGDNGVYSYTSFNTGYLGAVQYLDQQNGYLIRDGQLWRTDNSGSSWTKLGEEKIGNYFPVDGSVGLGISSDLEYTHHNFLITGDGGKSWSMYYQLRDFEYTICAGMINSVGLIGGYRGKMWKYIRE